VPLQSRAPCRAPKGSKVRSSAVRAKRCGSRRHLQGSVGRATVRRELQVTLLGHRASPTAQARGLRSTTNRRPPAWAATSSTRCSAVWTRQRATHRHRARTGAKTVRVPMAPTPRAFCECTHGPIADVPLVASPGLGAIGWAVLGVRRRCRRSVRCRSRRRHRRWRRVGSRVRWALRGWR